MHKLTPYKETGYTNQLLLGDEKRVYLKTSLVDYNLVNCMIVGLLLLKSNHSVTDRQEI